QLESRSFRQLVALMRSDLVARRTLVLGDVLAAPHVRRPSGRCVERDGDHKYSKYPHTNLACLPDEMKPGSASFRFDARQYDRRGCGGAYEPLLRGIAVAKLGCVTLFCCIVFAAQAQVSLGQEVVRGRAIAASVCSACHVVAADQAHAPILRNPGPSF